MRGLSLNALIDFQRHKAAPHRPLVVMLEHERIGEADDRAALGVDADASALRLFSLLTRSVGLIDESCAQCSLGQHYLAEHLLPRAVRHDGEQLVSLAQRIGDVAPLLVGGLGTPLGEDGLEHGGDGAMLLRVDMSQRVAHPVHSAALLGSGGHLAGRASQPLVVVGDHEFDAEQVAIGGRAQEALPERFDSARSDRRNNFCPSGSSPWRNISISGPALVWRARVALQDGPAPYGP